MTYYGHVCDGVVVLDGTPSLPEGTPVRVEVIDTTNGVVPAGGRRQGGQYAGQIRLAPDFDEWPEDLQEALGMKP